MWQSPDAHDETLGKPHFAVLWIFLLVPTKMRLHQMRTSKQARNKETSFFFLAGTSSQFSFGLESAQNAMCQRQDEEGRVD